MEVNLDHHNIAELSILQVIDALGSQKEYFGKIITQKTVYFLSQVFDVNLPYPFIFYHYGPYSFDLQHAIDKLQLFGAIVVSRDPNGIGYSYSITKEGKELLSKASLEEEVLKAIKKATEFVGDKTPTQLELLSTIHFANSTHKPENVQILVETVKYLKPKFAKDYIEEQIEFLKANKMIQESLS